MKPPLADDWYAEVLARAGARGHCELPRADYDALVRRATVLAVVLHDEGIPQGHARIMDATTNGVPLVMTRTAALERAAGWDIGRVPGRARRPRGRAPG